MDTTTTKKQLIDWIKGLDNETLLSGLKSIQESNKTDDWWDDLSDREKQKIDEGIKDADAGRMISNEEFWSRHRDDA